MGEWNEWISPPRSISLFLLQSESAVIVKGGFYLKKQYYSKTDFFWSLYCKMLLATCWIGGFVLGCMLWIQLAAVRSDWLASVELLSHSGILPFGVGTPILLGIGYCIAHLFPCWVSGLYVFLRAFLFAFCMLALSFILHSTSWWCVLILQGLLLSLEFKVYLQFFTEKQSHHTVLN